MQTCSIHNKILLSSVLTKEGNKQDWKDKPSSWPDIRRNGQNGHIYLLCDTRYPIGLVATVTGGYYVNIDGEFYGDYNSEAQFSMADWSSYTATEGYVIDYPTGATKAHILDIYPQNSANIITNFTNSRVAASDEEVQGTLWVHFNLDNAINFHFTVVGNCRQVYMEALTAKNNTVKIIDSIRDGFYYTKIAYVPVLEGTGSAVDFYRAFYNTPISEVNTKNIKPSTVAQCFRLGHYLKEAPKFDLSSVSFAHYYITSATDLKNTVFDFSAATGLRAVGVCGENGNNFMSGMKGLIVSNQAPFSGNSPQINVQYTDMNRTALAQLFNALPTISAGQIINIVGCTGTVNLTADDELIATAKGWTITK